MPDDRLTVQLPESLAFLLAERTRYKVIYGGRGGLKSWGCSTAGLIRGCERPTRFLCAREIQRTIADSVHQLLSDRISALNMGWHYIITDHEIKGRNGSQFLFAGLRDQDAHKIKSFEGVDVCWVEEANTVRKRSWEILLPTIRKPESEVWVTFNPELDSDETYQRFVASPPEGAIVVKLNYSDNPWPSPALDAEQADTARRYGAESEEYRNIWLGECRSAVQGAIYAKEVQRLIEGKRVCNVPIDPALKVHTVWDLGWNDSNAIILVQRTGSEVRIVDYIEDSHRTLADYVGDLEKRRVAWGHDWLPHDARAKNLQTGKSPEEVLQSLQRHPRIVENLDVEAGIQAARLMFSRVYIDKKCERLLHCLKRYRRQINQTTNEPGQPLHDEFSHGSDAFRYLAVIVDKITNQTTLPKIAYKTQGIV